MEKLLILIFSITVMSCCTTKTNNTSKKNTEEVILNNLNAVSKDKTTIIISHRVSSVKNADKIIVLDQGKIIQMGTHQELSNIEGFYQNLYNQQLMEQMGD